MRFVDDMRDSNGAWSIAGGGFCMLMLGIHVLAGMHSSGVADFWRDIYFAQQIAFGEGLPLSGPPIYRLFELGPWWYYLLAVPIGLTHRMEAAAVLIQVLAAAKYFLAWRSGTSAIDARFGLVFAISVAIAGWSTASMIFPTHSALVETALLLFALVTWHCWTSPRIGNFVLLGCSAATCLHAHPTTLSYVVIAGLALLLQHRRRSTVGLLAISVAIVALSLLPAWFNSEPLLDIQRESISAYAGQDFGVAIWSRIPHLIEALLVGGSWSGFLLLTHWDLTAVQFAWSLHLVCLILALVGVFLLPSTLRRLRIAFAAGAALVLIQAFFLVLIRPITPVWMVSSALPPLALMIAIGWYAWLRADQPAVRLTGLIALTIYTTLALAPFGFFTHHVHSARAMSQANPFMDVAQNGSTYTETPASPIRISQLDRIGSLLCTPTTLHGRLAAELEAALDTPARNACGLWPDLRFGGVDGPTAQLAGVSAKAGRSIGIAPDKVIAGIALYHNVRAIAPSHGGQPTRLKRMQVLVDAVRTSPGPLAFEFASNASDVIVIGNRLPSFAALQVLAVTANGQPAKGRFDDAGWLFFACADCADNAPVRWRMEVDGVQANLDIFSIAGKP